MGREDANSAYILSDRGIRQALEQQLISIDPPIEPDEPARFQPASIDVKVGESTTIGARGSSYVNLSEHLSVEHDIGGRPLPFFFTRSIRLRSSLHYLGAFLENPGKYFVGEQDGLHIHNDSDNPLHLSRGERIAQVLIMVHPHREPTGAPQAATKRLLELREQVQALDRGEYINHEDDVRALMEEGHFGEQSLEIADDKLLLHAYKAYRVRERAGGIEFSKRKQLLKELLEPIDISRGYIRKPHEHIIVQTRESFRLSPHVGLDIHENGVDLRIHSAQEVAISSDYLNQKSWADPGYDLTLPEGGPLTLVPKWGGPMRIYEGAVLGHASVVFFESGVMRPYGSEGLSSQYAGKQRLEAN